MKKDRRHQLAQNSLAKWLENKIETVKPHGPLISKVIIGLLLIALIYVAWQYFSKGNKANFSHDVASAVLFGVEEPSQITPMLIKYPNGGENAEFQILTGEVTLRQAEFQLTTKRDEAGKNLEQAMDCFQAAQKAATSSELQDRGCWGLARTHEVLAAVQDGNDLEEAKKLYEQLAGNEKSMYSPMARDQLEVLNRSWIPVFVASSRKFQPKEELLPNFDPTVPEPGTSGSGIDEKLNLEPEAAAAVTEDTTESEDSRK